MTGPAASDGEDALSRLHALDVLRGGLKTDEDDLFASVVPFLCVVCGEYDLTAGSAGRCAECSAEGLCRLECGSVELRVKQGVEVSGVDHRNGFLLAYHALVNEVAGDLQRSLCGALAVTGLEHIELTVLNGELHVLHITVVILKQLADLLEVGKRLGELGLHLGNGHGGANTCNDVLALCVGKELAHQVLFAGCGVTGECNAGAAVVAHVAERHHLNVDGGTPRVGDVVVAAVDVCTGVIPRAEDRLDCAHELLGGILREVLADLFLVLGLKLSCQLLEVVCVQLDVLSDLALLLHLVNELLEVLLADLHNDVGIHLDKAAVAVPRPTGVAGLCRHDLDDFLVKTEVQDGIHHTGHGCTGAGTNGNKQRILKIAELLAGDLLQLFDVLHDLRHDLVAYDLAVVVITGAGLGGDSEALRYGETDIGHLRQVCALAAKQLTHLCIAFGKQINILLAH